MRDGEDWILNGAKTFITNGINADLVIVAVRTGEDRHRGLSLLVVERGMPGFERGRRLEKMGMHAQDTAELSFTDVRVPAANMLAAEGAGFLGLTRNLAQERVSAAASAVASAEAALQLTVDYVRERRAFGSGAGRAAGHPLRDRGAGHRDRHRREVVDRCILALNAGELTPVDAAKAKRWSTELLGRAVDTGVQLHGGYGYMAEYRSRKRGPTRVQRIYAGTTEIMKDLIGRSMRLA